MQFIIVINRDRSTGLYIILQNFQILDIMVLSYYAKRKIIMLEIIFICYKDHSWFSTFQQAGENIFRAILDA